MDTKNKLQKKIEQIKTKEDFLHSPCSVACWYAYQFHKNGKWTREQFDKALKTWWRYNHQKPREENQPENPNLLDDIREVFK